MINIHFCYPQVFTGTILATFGWMVLCNGAILVALKRSRGSGKDDMHPMKKKAFKMVMSVLSIIVFNYLPPVALFPFQVMTWVGALSIEIE